MIKDEQMGDWEIFFFFLSYIKQLLFICSVCLYLGLTNLLFEFSEWCHTSSSLGKGFVNKIKSSQ